MFKWVSDCMSDYIRQRTIYTNLQNRLLKTEIPLVVDLGIVRALKRQHGGVKFIHQDEKCVYDIAKNVNEYDVFVIDMKHSGCDLLSALQTKLNIPYEYNLKDIFSKRTHAYIFIINLPTSYYIQAFLCHLQKESMTSKAFTIVFCEKKISQIEYLMMFDVGFEFLG